MIVEVEHQRHGVDLIKIDNDETKIIFTNYGAGIVSWKYHDNNTVLGNVVEADEFYFDNPFKFGASIGRYSGRIKDTTFKLNEQQYKLEQNDQPHHIHGGKQGLDSKLFDYEIFNEIGQIRVVFTTTLQSQEDNFPGDLEVKITHTYDADHQWSIDYEAVATEDTLFNPTNHVYFNLNRDNNVVDNHRLYSEHLNMHLLDDQNIVTDEVVELHDIFSDNKIKLSDIFTSEHPQLQQQMAQYGGLDHPFTVGNDKLFVENHEFSLEVETDMPNIVMFTFNQPEAWQSDFNIYKAHSGFTLEAQFMPNDINIDGDKALSILRAGEPFHSKTSYRIHEYAVTGNDN
ncbi:aldose epimerase family protein [Staphylococcus simiae]|uniref:aldose epimerase family protein n=1 Tax=Staphylococcus simiae TaxID=308354 RepID=UPI001A963E4A|nr:aldose epimerase family protein [Staphylococcus simiae]QSY53601.1 galactose mutarotase [Staphylococcus simiae]